MKTRALILLSLWIAIATGACAAQGQQPPVPPPAPDGSQAPASAPTGTQQAPSSTPAPSGPKTPAPDFKYFFTATDTAFEGYLDQANIKVDPEGNKLVTVKLTKFSAAFRGWIKNNFPGGETADYAIDSYSIDCEAKKVGEHEITWYESSGTELANYDFGGILATPMNYSMKDNLMKKMCGIP